MIEVFLSNGHISLARFAHDQLLKTHHRYNETWQERKIKLRVLCISPPRVCFVEGQTPKKIH